MSIIHPRGSRLDPINSPPVNGTPVYGPRPTSPAAPSGGQYTGSDGVLRNADGSRAVSGKTKAARGAAGGGGGTTTTTGGGSSSTTDGGGGGGGGTTTTTGTGKSGKTLAARANAELIASIEKYFLIGALIVGSIYVVRHFHLLSGGNAGGGGDDPRPRRHPSSGRFHRGEG